MKSNKKDTDQTPIEKFLLSENPLCAQPEFSIAGGVAMSLVEILEFNGNTIIINLN